MHLSSLVDIIDSAFDDRALLAGPHGPVTGARLAELARRGALDIRSRAETPAGVVYAGENHPLLPVMLLSAACAGVPFVPINYRLDDSRLNELVDRQHGAVVLCDGSTRRRIAAGAVDVDDWLASLADDDAWRGRPLDALDDLPRDDHDVAIVLYTSGTTSEPKSALLRHRHLMAYLLGSVELGGASEDEAALISVPPYHVAGMANLLSNLFAGRRLVYLRHFDAQDWLTTVRRESITHAMVVPTMLARIVDQLGTSAASTPTLISLSYGGARMPAGVLRAALAAFPDTGFVNAYGLTETASTISVLTADDHRAALTSQDPRVQARLTSAGRPLPSVEIQMRDENDAVLPAGSSGMVYVRGEQVAGEYATGSLLDAEGWFCTRDSGFMDEDGYLFIEGRVDDTIIRGGENIAPSEIEDVLIAQPGVAEACVFGVPDDEWGERIVAAIVPRPGAHIDAETLREAVRTRLRGSKTPDVVIERPAFPHTETGKLLRRLVADDVITLLAPAPDDRPR